MGVSDELLWLLHQIRSSRSPIERLKLLARGWRSVRELSADDRRTLARELGVDGAEELVEQLAHRGGMSPSNLLGMLHRAEQSDPAVVLESIRGLAEPQRRGAAAGELLDTVSEILVDGQAHEAREPPAPGGSGAEVKAQHTPPAPAFAPTQRHLAAPPAAAPPAGGEPGRPLSFSPPDSPEPRPPRPGPPGVRPPAAPGRRRSAAAAEKPGTRSAPEAGPGRGRADRRPAERTASAASRPPSETGLAMQLGAESSLLRRLRLLSAAAGRHDDAGLEELRAVLGCFPAGWARRRALQRLLEAGVPRSAADAIELLAVLQRPSERAWAATTLAASRPLDDRERDALLAAVPSPALRRRLGSRMARQWRQGERG